MQVILCGVIGFAAVVGWALLRWGTKGRDPSYPDDPSILLAAPPEGMTPATATIVDGGPSRTAFVAALLDLASRGDIGFRDETPNAAGSHHVGIELYGHVAEDPRVALNRSRPNGEGEAWLLANLKGFAASSAPGLEKEERVAAMLGALSGFLGTAGPALAGPPLSEDGTQRDAAGAPMLALIGDILARPESLGTDPAALAKRIEAATGRAPTADDMDRLHEWLGAHGGAMRIYAAQRDGEAGPDTYIDAARATTFHAPVGFATMVENYARRNGWIAGLSFVARWKWHGLAAAEVIVGLLVANLGVADQGALYGAGLGVAAGGLATWFIAPFMASRTREGAVMKARLAAYRRTLKATFDSASTLDGVGSTTGMTWLTTSDQTLVWGVALGLRPEIEALLQRTAGGVAAGTVPATAFLPRWIEEAATAVVARAVAAGASAARAASEAAGPILAGEPGPAASSADAANRGQRPQESVTRTRPVPRLDYAAIFAGLDRIGSAPGTSTGILGDSG